MLPKKQRFTRMSFPTGSPTVRKGFSWGTVSRYSTAEPRAAVVVSKKTLKKAHDRNRAKRRVYAALAPFTLSDGVVVHLRREALTAPAVDMHKDIASVLQ